MPFTVWSVVFGEQPTAAKWNQLGENDDYLKAEIEAEAVPTGTIFSYSASSAPTGYLLCDGTAVSRATYSTLFSLIGTDYGTGDGSTTFNTPNLKGKVPVGRDAAQTEFDALGETGGAKTHTLSIAEMPAHTHLLNVMPNRNYTGSGFNPIDPSGGITGDATQSTGGGGAHNNLQPYLTLNFIIRT